MGELSTTQHAPQTPQQRRREIVQAAKAEVIDCYRTSLGQVTPAMRGDAKAAIERELNMLPLEELPIEEVIELAAAIRDRVYVPAFTRQAKEAERRDTKKEAQRRTDLEALGNLRRADRRKQILIQQVSNQAQAYCKKREITRWAQVSVVGDIEARLGELLSGDEAITEAQGIVQCVLEARFEEAEATLAAAKAKENAKWREDMLGLLVLAGLLAMPLVAQRYPVQVMAFFQWIERTFGLNSASEAGPASDESSETTASNARSSAPRRPRRWRKHSASPSTSEHVQTNS